MFYLDANYHLFLQNLDRAPLPFSQIRNGLFEIDDLVVSRLNAHRLVSAASIGPGIRSRGILLCNG